MRYYCFLAVLVAVTSVEAGCGGVVGNVTATQSGANTVNGSINVPAGLHSGDLATVNGSIEINDNATVGTVNTVNGKIVMGAHATAESLTTVNGGVTLGTEAHVARSATAVNGGMILNTGADIAGSVGNVNGRIALSAAHVGGGLRTVDGDISVANGSRVEGGVLVERSTGWFNFNLHKPRIVIGPGAVVQGDLRFERNVQLYLSDKATVGPITGATAVRFSGDNPPTE